MREANWFFFWKMEAVQNSKIEVTEAEHTTQGWSRSLKVCLGYSHSTRSAKRTPKKNTDAACRWRRSRSAGSASSVWATCDRCYLSEQTAESARESTTRRDSGDVFSRITRELRIQRLVIVCLTGEGCTALNFQIKAFSESRLLNKKLNRALNWSNPHMLTAEPLV